MNGKKEHHILPLHVVLHVFFDQPNPLQHVSNVINPPLLHLQPIRCFVQVQLPSLCRPCQVSELLGEESQGCVVSALGVIMGIP